MTRKTTVCATFPEKLAIKALLDERLHPVEGTELFRYEDGWNDEVVAKTAHERLAGNIVAKIRTECFGKLFNHGRTPGRVNASLKVRVALLEGQLERLIDWVNPLPIPRAFILKGTTGPSDD